MPEKSVIQTAAAAHDKWRDEMIAATEQYLRLTTALSEDEIAARLKGVAEGWNFATFAILSGGNCKFESEG